MTESLASNETGEQKRRSTRITQAVPITVTGVDALGQPFKERTTTIGVNCHGCKYQSKHYVPKNSMVTLEIPRPEAGRPPRTIAGRVIWVQRPRTVRELFQIGLEFDIAGNIWGIAFPPEDWFPYPDDEAAGQTAAPSVTPTQPEARVSGVAKAPSIPTFEIPSMSGGPAPGLAAFTAPVTPAPADSKIHVVPPAPAVPSAAISSQEAQLASARQMAKMVAEAKDTLDKTMRRSAQSAVNDEMTVARQQLDAQLHEAVERAIKVSMERVSESAAKKVVQQAAERTSAIVEEARKATSVDAAQLDAKVREAVQAAVGNVAQQAAQQAAEQAAAANLKLSVEQAVERVIAEREANSPSLQILSSPEAAQAQLDQWKKNLEDASQTTRTQALEQAQTEAAAVSQRMQQEFEAAVARTSENVGQKLSEAAQAALAKAEEDLAARNAALRSTLDETLANARNSVQSVAAEAQNAVRAATDNAQNAAQSITASLEEERRRAEATKADLQQATQAALAKAAEDLSARNAALRSALDETVANAQNSVQSSAAEAQNAVRAATENAQNAAQSIAASLEQERARAEATHAGLREAAQNALTQAEEDFAAKSVGLRARLEEALANAHGSIASASTDAQKTVQSMTESAQSAAKTIAENLEQERLRSEIAQAELRQAALSAIEETQRSLDELFVTQKNDIARRTDEVIQERTQHVEPMLRNSADKVLQHFAAEMDQKVTPVIADAQRTVTDLANATQQAALIRESIGKQAREASEQAVQESVARLREEAVKIPTEVEEAARLTLSKTAQELDQKASETQHETYEALLKASDWYTKKAHTTMQGALEKAVEQSTSSLRDRAAEISSLAASELDHQRRAYVNHAQGQIEEGAKEVTDRERGKLVENAEIASAGFANRINELTADSFRRFEESSRTALEKSRSDMEFLREGSLVEYEKKIEERISQGIEQARTHLQSNLVPMMEEWDAARESEKRLWMENLKRQTDESIEHYKTRLENASNSWLLASAATLGQNSQAMLDTLAKAAEKRIRETCADVLAGMGDQLKERLIGISTKFAPEDSDDPPPPKRKV